MPDLALIGYGKMGKLVDELAPQYGFNVTARVDLNRPDALAGADVAIEFTEAAAVLGHIAEAARLGVPIVVGTTGWLKEMEQAKAIVARHGAALVWSPNFSIGVNVFNRLVAQAASLLKDQSEYEAWAWEIHHSAKKDAPSGTLLKLVETMKEAGFSRNVDAGSNRAGAHPGTHEIGFDSGADTITLRHTARSREGFARGALKAAQWILGRRGFYDFNDVLWSPPESARKEEDR